MEEHFYSAISDDWIPDTDRRALICQREKDKKSRILHRPVQIILITEAIILGCYYMEIVTFQTAVIVAISVSFTWFHIWLALKMCFHPLEFRGFRFGRLRVGWNGIVPSKASRMAHKSCDLMIDKLIIVDDIIDSVKGPEMYRFLKTLGFVSTINTAILQKLTTQYFSNLYLPDVFKRQILSSVEDASYTASVAFVSRLTDRLKDRSFFNIRDLIVSKFVSDKRLLVDLFTNTGRSELLFIELSGAFMGLLCGLSQVFILQAYPDLLQNYNPYLVFGVLNFFIGYMTNWFALYIIFNPIDPVRITRSFQLHGLFLRRQPEASRVYAKIVTDSVLNLQEIVRFLQLYPDKWNEIRSMFSNTVAETVDESLPRVPFLSGSSRTNLVACISQTACEEISKSPQIFSSIIQFLEIKLNLYDLISRKFINLPSRDFEQMLHPVFQEDEFLLILIGGILGALVGVLQVTLFHL